MADATSYNHQTVSLDGESFRSSEFSHCRLIYAGGPVPDLEGSKFNDCEWSFQHAAADTLAFLKVLWGAGAKADVQSAIKEITAAR